MNGENGEQGLSCILPTWLSCPTELGQGSERAETIASESHMASYGRD